MQEIYLTMDSDSYTSKNSECWQIKCLQHITDKLISILYSDNVNISRLDNQCNRIVRYPYRDEQEEEEEVKM